MNDKTIENLYTGHRVKFSLIAQGFLLESIDQWIVTARQMNRKSLPTREFVFLSYVRDHVTIAIDPQTQYPVSVFVFRIDLDKYINGLISSYELDIATSDLALLVLGSNNDLYRKYAEHDGFKEAKEGLSNLRDTYWDFHHITSKASILIFARSILLLDHSHLYNSIEESSGFIDDIVKSTLSRIVKSNQQDEPIKETINKSEDLTIHYSIKYEGTKNVSVIHLSCNNKSISLNRSLGKRYVEFLLMIIKNVIKESDFFIKAGTTLILDSDKYNPTGKTRLFRGKQIPDIRFYQIDHINKFIREHVQLSSKKNLKCFSQRGKEIAIRVNIKFRLQ